jgi:hypothetical protein
MLRPIKLTIAFASAPRLLCWSCTEIALLC